MAAPARTYDDTIPHDNAETREDLGAASKDLANQLMRISEAVRPFFEATTDGEVAAAKARAVTAFGGLGRAASSLQMANEAVAQSIAPQDKIQISTKVPAGARWGVKVELPGPREYKLLDFYGKPSDKDTCTGWLRKVMEQCNSLELTEQVSIDLLKRHSMGTAAEVVELACMEERTMENVVRQLEINFANLVHPDIARQECGAMVREPKETLTDFALRIYIKAKMATRREIDQDKKMLELSKQTFQRNLNPLVKNHLKAIEHTRLAAGYKPLPLSSYVNQADQYEKDAKIGPQAKVVANVKFIQEDEDPPRKTNKRRR